MLNSLSRVWILPVIALAMSFGTSILPASAQGVRTGTTITGSCAEAAKQAFGDQLKSATCIPLGEGCTNADQKLSPGSCQEGSICCATMVAADPCQAAAKAAGGSDKDGVCHTSADCKRYEGTELPGSMCGEGYICCSLTPQIVGYSNETALKDPLGDIGILGILNRVVTALLGVLGALALLGMIYGGIVYMTAGGDSGRVKHAVDTLKFGIIGLALIVFSYAVVYTFFRTLVPGF